jgi:hypothetical protein
MQTDHLKTGVQAAPETTYISNILQAVRSIQHIISIVNKKSWQPLDDFTSVSRFILFSIHVLGLSFFRCDTKRISSVFLLRNPVSDMDAIPSTSTSPSLSLFSVLRLPLRRQYIIEIPIHRSTET